VRGSTVSDLAGWHLAWGTLRVHAFRKYARRVARVGCLCVWFRTVREHGLYVCAPFWGCTGGQQPAVLIPYWAPPLAAAAADEDVRVRGLGGFGRGQRLNTLPPPDLACRRDAAVQLQVSNFSWLGGRNMPNTMRACGGT
jgi:hypothetical protein